MRLPAFLKSISPLGETLAAIDHGAAFLEADTAHRNAQLTPATANSTLSLWERDYGLHDGSGTAADIRRTRIRAAMCGRQTLTCSRLEQLAVSVGGAAAGLVEETPSAGQVTLLALYRDCLPEDTAELERAVRLFQPAHLEVQVVSGYLLTHCLPRHLALRGGVLLTCGCRQAAE